MHKSDSAAVQALLRFRVEGDTKSSSKEHLKLMEKAVKRFVKRNAKTQQIKDLQMVLETKDPRSNCITMPRSALDSVESALLYLQLWRWPNLHEVGQLFGEPFCKHKLTHATANDPNGEVCINPYHYKLVGCEQRAMSVSAPVGNRRRDGNSGSAMSVTPNDRSANCETSGLSLSGAFNAGVQSEINSYTFGSAPVNVDLKHLPMANAAQSQLHAGLNSTPFNTDATGYPYSANQVSTTGQQQVGSGGVSNFAVPSSVGIPSAYATRIDPTPTVNGSTTVKMDFDIIMDSDVSAKRDTGLASPAVSTSSSLAYGTQPVSCFNNTQQPTPAQTQSATGYNAAQQLPAARNDSFLSTGSVPNSPSPALTSPGVLQPQPVGVAQPLIDGNDVLYSDVLYVEPTCWCSVQYYEKQHLGEVFHCTWPTLVIDGFCDPSSPRRFCLGRISNPNRELEAEHVRRQIQLGVKLYYVAGEVYLENLSDNSVFVQSSNMNVRNGWPPYAVCKLGAGDTAQLFANHDFASLLSRSVNEGYESVRKLLDMCSIRMSFVKGWGTQYRSQSLNSVPCWVEICLNGPLQWLDRVLRQMDPDVGKATSIS